MPAKKIGKMDIRTIQPNQILWDGAVTGFGIRRQRSDSISYVLVYRTKSGRQRWHTIGKHGKPWTPETARNEATRLLGAIVTGEDPAQAKATQRAAIDVARLCTDYLADAKAGRLLTRRRVAKKDSTLSTDAVRINRHIIPLLGSEKVSDVTREDIETFMHEVAAGKTAVKASLPGRTVDVREHAGKGSASRTVGLLGAIFQYAIRKSLRTDNPAHGIARFADQKRTRRLSDVEYRELGRAFERTRDVWPPSVAVAKFLLLTGWRSGEAVNLKRAEVDVERRTALLADSKTGRSLRPLATVACAIISEQSSATEYVFPASRGTGAMVGFHSLWLRIAAGMPKDVTPHTLRHSYASLASDMGFSEATIAALIGHAGQGMTSRYIHSADAVLLAAADAIAAEIARRMQS